MRHGRMKHVRMENVRRQTVKLRCVEAEGKVMSFKPTLSLKLSLISAWNGIGVSFTFFCAISFYK